MRARSPKKVCCQLSARTETEVESAFQVLRLSREIGVVGALKAWLMCKKPASHPLQRRSRPSSSIRSLTCCARALNRTSLVQTELTENGQLASSNALAALIVAGGVDVIAQSVLIDEKSDWRTSGTSFAH